MDEIIATIQYIQNYLFIQINNTLVEVGILNKINNFSITKNLYKPTLTIYHFKWIFRFYFFLFNLFFWFFFFYMLFLLFFIFLVSSFFFFPLLFLLFILIFSSFFSMNFIAISSFIKCSF